MKVSIGRIAVWTLVGFALFIVMPLLVTDLVSVPGAILFGWFSFLKRMLPNVSISWSGTGMVLLCSALILVGLHSFSAWLFGHAATALNRERGVTWRWSWTVSLYLAVWFLFAAIMGAVGVAHQVGWLVRSSEPMFKSRKYPNMWRSQLRQASIELYVAADESEWKMEPTRRKFFEDASVNSQRPNAIEYLHVIMLPGTNGTMRAGIIFLRDVEAQAKSDLMLVTPEVQAELKPMAALPTLLEKFQGPHSFSSTPADK